MNSDAFCRWGKAAIGLASSMPLWLVSPPAVGHPPAKPERAAKPSINLSKLTITSADLQSAEGFFTITNNTSGGNSVQVERIEMAWQWIGQGGARETCRSARFATSPVTKKSIIPGGAQQRVDYRIECNRPPSFSPQEIRNFVAIELVGRDKIFSSSGSFKAGDGTTTPPPSTTTRFEEGAATYSGSWTPRGAEIANFSGGSAVSSNTAGSSASFGFTGTRVSWIGLKCSICGIATVRIDGGTPSTVNTSSSASVGSGASSQVVFTSPTLTSGNHTMLITVTGDTSSDGAHIVVDAFDVTP